MQAEDHIVTTQVLDIPYAYPRQTPNRVENVRLIHDYLKQHDIHPVGRFAEWEYYNMHDIIPRTRDLALQLEMEYGDKMRLVEPALPMVQF